MTTLNVQFFDGSDTTIVSYFGGPQDPSIYENQGLVETSDPRWKTYYDAQGAFGQQYLPAPQ